jgi:hypothetical protein
MKYYNANSSLNSKNRNYTVEFADHKISMEKKLQNKQKSLKIPKA